MNAENTETREPLDDAITDDQIQRLIDERVATGAENCNVLTENGQRFLVCTYPPL